MDNNDIFLDFWKQYQWTEPKPVLYRLYHDDHGRPLFYTQEDLPGKYIDITPEQFQHGRMDVVVKSGVLEKLPPPRLTKLRPGPEGTPCHPNNVSIVVHPGKENIKWSLNHDKD